MSNGLRKSLDVVFAVAVGVVIAIVVDTWSCYDFYVKLACARAFCKR